MKRRCTSLLRLRAPSYLVVLPLLATLGCSSPPCTGADINEDVEADAALRYTESAKQASFGFDAGVSSLCRDAGTSACSVPVSFIDTYPFDENAHCPVQTGANAPAPLSQIDCLVAFVGGQSSITLGFYRPLAAGSYRLEDLAASLCDDDCAALAGQLNVQEVVVPCGPGACGRFEADVTIAPPAVPTAGAPALSGTAHLHYAESAPTCGGMSPFGLGG